LHPPDRANLEKDTAGHPAVFFCQKLVFAPHRSGDTHPKSELFIQHFLPRFHLEI
jgi:hypothetical protein